MKRVSNITNVPPSYPDREVKTGFSWLDAKRVDDNCENGLWRIHNTLYDLTEFINVHPGGPDWLRWTKGTDITEAFETHHIYPANLRSLMDKYRVRDTTAPRNIKLTFKENGFYRTLHRRVGEKLLHVKKTGPMLKSKIFSDGLFAATLLMAVIALRYQSYLAALICGLLNTWTAISGHNFFHRRDNFRMKYFNLSFMSFRDWRITHALSHHLYPNSLQDVETVAYEPIFYWLPDGNIKGWFHRYGAWLYSPFVYVFLYPFEFTKKIVDCILNKNPFYLDDCLPLVVPTVMYTFANNHSLQDVMSWWITIVFMSSFLFSFIGFNAGHHHPHSVHDGDALRDDLDWGIYTIGTIVERKEIRTNHFFVLVHFGDHVLHHLFPTLDHGILPNFYPELFQTMKEFETEFMCYPWIQCFSGQFQQLARVETMTKNSYERSKYFEDTTN